VAANSRGLNARRDLGVFGSGKSCARSVPKSCAEPLVYQKVLASFWCTWKPAALENKLGYLLELQDSQCNIKAASVSAFLSTYIGGKEGTRLRREVGIPYVTSHQKLGICAKEVKK
jgi:hypothetical protein